MASVLLCYTNLNSAVLKQEIRGGKEHVYLCLSVHARVCVYQREIDRGREKEREGKKTPIAVAEATISLPSLL